MISMGADVNGLDPYENSGLWRFCLQANQILSRYDYTNDCEGDDRIFTDELHSDLLKVLKLLSINGADFEYISPNTKTDVREFYRKGALSILIKETFE